MVHRKAKETLTAIELGCGETQEFELLNGQVRTLTLEDTSAAILLTNIDRYGEQHTLGRTMYHFCCRVCIDGHPMTLERYVCSQETFYEPYVVNGMRIWFDAVLDIFDLFKETHGACRPSRQARFALQDVSLPICPQEVRSWCPDEENLIDIGRCYNGDDPWMGPYLGFDAHGGMDINHPQGTPLWAPIDFDDHFYFNSLEMGHNNNRWRALRTWPDGSTWTLQTHHMLRLLVPEHTSLAAGTHFAEGAGVLVGSHDHSHFVFKVQEPADGTKDRPDDRVEIMAKVTPEETLTDGSVRAYPVHIGDRVIDIPKDYALHLQRPGRQGSSTFLVPRSFATEHDIPYTRPQVLLDPWIIFWQIFENKKQGAGEIRAVMAPLSPASTGAPVVFSSDGSRKGLDGIELRYHWTFGDGGYSTDLNPTHTYLNPGIYPVTLVVDDGLDRASCTQHITVDGDPIDVPGLVLNAPDEFTFRRRPIHAMDVYGWPVRYTPHTLHLTARGTRPVPATRSVSLANAGGGTLADATAPCITYAHGAGWLKVKHSGTGNEQTLDVSVNADDLAPGTYKAIVSITCPGAINARQSFCVVLDVPSEAPRAYVIIDPQDEGFYATPWFWVGHRFDRWEEPGYDDFYLVNGQRATEGEFCRFTPDLQAGTYQVRLHETSPLDPNSSFDVRVRHRRGETVVRIKPDKSRLIGTFEFDEGTDGYVEILAGGSIGQVVADAVVFAMD
jgi:hypothetical protein